ncbi:hypothetical protein EDB81DRAFT_846199 [Dactylonectria macrodidyma]|uniref:Kievitone hydratase n=1 Tax=Dactylonectria macrodidyma TaxID=307937 RepID=A0A9P9ILY3_9HYPO|nr:hypothetical protein EDB81DRAFT_846199 [Dactylonectria macrodidyma]
MKSFYFLALASSSAAYVFKPENAQSYKSVTGSSYWASSFISGADGDQYLAISHILTTNLPDPVCRSSVLDLRTNKYWVDLTYCKPQENDGFDKLKPFALDYGTYGFASSSDDSVSSLRTWAEANNSHAIDIRWNATSKILMNGGGGVIAEFGPGYNATQWSVPASRTEGTIIVDGKTIAVDPENSFTWYDRQISHGVPRNWTWFNVMFPGSDVKASVWAYDFLQDEEKNYRFATVREKNSIQVLSYTLDADWTNTWTSPSSGIVYPLRWTLKFDNGDYLDIASVLEEQEMYGDRALSDSAYEGFVTIKGRFFGQRKGFGVAELVTAY